MPDLTEIPGLTDLWAHTWSDPCLTIAVLDGPADLARACFRSARLTAHAPYWQDRIAIDPADLAAFLKVENSADDDGTKAANLEAAIPDTRTRGTLSLAAHATHISSTIFGQLGSPVEGIAPRCTGINIPIAYDNDNFIDPFNLTRALETALEAGAHIIHVTACHPTSSGLAHDLLARAVRRAQDRNMLIVAPGGNDRGKCWCIPAVLPDVLTVGAMCDSGEPFQFSNWGGPYQMQGVLAPGENVLGALPGTDKPIRHRGTSCAAPIVNGVAALLLSLQLQRGMDPDPDAVRRAIVGSAIPCDPNKVEKPERRLLDRLNIRGAVERLTGETLAQVIPSGAVQPSNGGVTVSAGPNWVYALGMLDYDFGTEARRDAFKQRMPAVESDGAMVPANPYEARQMAAYLAEHPSEARSLIWTLNQDLTPVYALQPAGPFGADGYTVLQRLLAAQVAGAGRADAIERVSIPGRLTGRRVRLFSGQDVPVVALQGRRGIYGWQVQALVRAALDAVRTEPDDADEAAIERALQGFLHRVYYDLRTEGRTSRDRALNFAATNAFQAATTFAEAVARGLELDRIDVNKSPFCRIYSDCWDVRLTFFDPENHERARRVFHFTIDVVDRLPVTLGEVQSWSMPN